MDLSKLSIRLLKLGLVSKLYLNKELRGIGLYNGQMQILSFIRQHPNCTQIEISQALNVSPASIALSTKRMEKNKLIKKTIEEDNLRCKHLVLTELGEKVLDECLGIYSACESKMFDGFTEKELEIFASYVDKITINLSDEQNNNLDEEFVADLIKEVEALSNNRKKNS